MATITVTIESFDGRMAAIPECSRAKAFCQLVDKDWLSPEQIKLIQKIGFEIIEKEQRDEND